MGKRKLLLTDKRLNNKRFRRTEEAIMLAVWEKGSLVSVGSLTQRAGLARSTFYRHHRTVYMIIPDYERYLVGKYARMARRLMRQKVQLKNLYLRMLFFMVGNRKMLGLILKENSRSVIKQMVFCLKPRVEGFARLPKNSDKMFNIYTNEVVGLIEKWGEEEFIEDRIEVLLKDIMYLTETIRKRLGALED